MALKRGNEYGLWIVRAQNYGNLVGRVLSCAYREYTIHRIVVCARVFKNLFSRLLQ